MPISEGKGKSIADEKLANNRYAVKKYNEMVMADPDTGEGAGAANTGFLNVQTGEAVIKGNAAALFTDGKYYNATNSRADGLKAVGIFQNDSGIDEQNSIAISRGLLVGVDTNVTLTVGGPVYLKALDINDVNIGTTILSSYTSGPPIEDFIQYLGEAIATDTFILDIKEPGLLFTA